MFTGKPLSHDLKRKVIWSPGADFVDRGGALFKGTPTPPHSPAKWPHWYLDNDMTWELP